MRAEALSGGFSDPARHSARAFRAALDAMARPGTIRDLGEGDGVAAPPAPLSPAAGTLILALTDTTTGVFLAPSHDTQAVRDWITFHTGAPFVAPGAAAFAVGDWAGLQPLHRFPVGLADYPDRSATLIVEQAAIAAEGARLTGPGIATEAHLNLPEVAGFAANAALYPRGLDFFLTAGRYLAALPRTTKVEAG